MKRLSRKSLNVKKKKNPIYLAKSIIFKKVFLSFMEKRNAGMFHKCFHVLTLSRIIHGVSRK